MRITEPGYDGQFISYITNKLKAFDAIDRIIVDDFTEAIPLMLAAGYTVANTTQGIVCYREINF